MTRTESETTIPTLQDITPIDDNIVTPNPTIQLGNYSNTNFQIPTRKEFTITLNNCQNCTVDFATEQRGFGS